MRVGFTGTRKGLTNDQTLQVHMLLGDLQSAGATQANHGMCMGADKQFHDMAKALGYFIVGFPGITHAGTEFERAPCVCDITQRPKPFLMRNHDIVDESDVVIATPKDTTEQWRGSGVWATIRYARRIKKPLLIVWPDGTGLVEQIPGVITLDQYRACVGTP